VSEENQMTQTTPDAPTKVTTMRAAVARRFGPPEVVQIERIPVPVPQAGEVLIRVHATTVSIADHRLRAKDLPRGLGYFGLIALGVFRPRKKVLGMEASGVIERVGPDVTDFSVGDEVITMNGARFGCHAEYVTARAAGPLVRKPEGMSHSDAAALVFGGFTAVSFLGQVEIGPDSAVLVNGASGAVGTAAVQLAAHAGARVTAVTSGRNADLVRSLGAERVIDYTREDFARGDARYDVIVECVGNAPFERVRDVIRPGGALLLVIADLRGMLAARGQSRRSGVKVVKGDSGAAASVMRDLFALAEEGAIRPVIDRTYTLGDIVEAHRYVDTGRKRGSVVITVVEPDAS
jgi:NADPH:quinone reductase-like Zn-dependent oxidoreductase